MSPLAEGRELKSMRISSPVFTLMLSPLAEGRELKYRIQPILLFDHVAPRGGA